MRGLASEIQEDLITMVSHLDDAAKKELFNLYREKTEGKQRSPELLLSFLKYLVKKDFSWFTRIFIQCSEGQEFDFALHAQILCEVCQQHSADNLKYDNDVLINIPPGHSKTLICNVLYSAWLLGNHPAMRILVRTNNDTMAVKTNNNTALIMTSKAYKEAFGNIVVNLTNNQIKTFDGKAYGYRSSTAIGTRVTGESAELIICFPYSQEVLTDKGILKIGDIVEKKIKCKVKSWDNDNNKFVWSDITRYIKNESDTGYKMLSLGFTNGFNTICTDNHSFFVRGFKRKEAKSLTSRDEVFTSSNISNMMFVYSIFFHKICDGIIFISNFFKLIISKINKISFWCSSCFNNILCKTLERFASFNCLNGAVADVKPFSNFCNTASSPAYIGNIFTGKFASTKTKRSNFYGILHIFTFSAVAKIFQSVVSWVRIQMSCFHTSRTFANESQENKTMHQPHLLFSFFGKRNNLMPVMSSASSNFAVIARFFYKLFLFIRTIVFTINRFFKCLYRSIRASLIKSFITRYVFVNNIAHTKNCKTTYCISTALHNFIIYNSQAKTKFFIVSNCDDLNAVSGAGANDSATYQSVINQYEGALSTRQRGTDNSLQNLVIQQRVSMFDVSAHILEVAEQTERPINHIIIRAWEDEDTTFVIPCKDYDRTFIRPSGYLWYPKSPKMYEKRMNLYEKMKTNPYLWASQYQQDPSNTGLSLVPFDYFNQYSCEIEELPLIASFITCDIAFSGDTKNSDRTCICSWGLSANGDVYLLDILFDRYPIEHIPTMLIEFYKKNKMHLINTKEHDALGHIVKQTIFCYAFFIEEEKNETLITFLKNDISCIKVLQRKANTTKLIRLNKALPILALKVVYLPKKRFFKEIEMFKEELRSNTAETFDMVGVHNDMLDNVFDAVNEGRNQKFIDMLNTLQAM